MRSRLTLGLFLVVLAAGCDSPGLSKKTNTADAAKNAAPVKSETTTTGATLDTSGFKGGPSIDTNALSVSSEIARACGIAGASNAKTRPSFEFDSAALNAEDRKMLGDVVKCLTDGALRGRNVALIGRTDPRGEPEYNMGLGGSRADAVDRYMIDLGIGRDRLSATSRGEMDAVGKDEAGWAQDRRVDIELVKN